MKNVLHGVLVDGHDWGKTLWVWGYVNRNFQNQRAKRIKTEKNRIEYPRIVGQLQEM